MKILKIFKNLLLLSSKFHLWRNIYIYIFIKATSTQNHTFEKKKKKLEWIRILWQIIFKIWKSSWQRWLWYILILYFDWLYMCGRGILTNDMLRDFCHDLKPVREGWFEITLAHKGHKNYYNKMNYKIISKSYGLKVSTMMWLSIQLWGSATSMENSLNNINIVSIIC